MLNKQPLKIVAIGHETSLSGAPILLFNLFALLKEKATYSIEFAILRDGPLTPMYKALFPVLILKSSTYGKEINILQKAYNFINNKIQLGRLAWRIFNCDFIFSNTIVNGKVIRLFSLFGKPVITYVHELESVIDTYLQLGNAVYSIESSDVFAYPSEKVRSLLQHRYSIPPEKLLPLSYYFPFKNSSIITDFAMNLNGREKYGIATSDFVVGGMGFASERKGTDLFVDVFNLVYSKNQHIKFCWVGDFESDEFKRMVYEKIPKDAFGKNIIFTGSLINSFSNYTAMDMFFLSSREDPYPLVVLEAAWMGKPSICFKDSGGIPEFVEDDAGWIVENYDMQSVCNRILDLFNNHSEIEAKGNCAREKVVRLHGDGDLVSAQFEHLLLNAKASG